MRPGSAIKDYKPEAGPRMPQIIPSTPSVRVLGPGFPRGRGGGGGGGGGNRFLLKAPPPLKETTELPEMVIASVASSSSSKSALGA